MLFNANEHVRDVQTAEDLLNKHAEIGDEIRAKQNEFGSLIQLGQKMYGRQPGQETDEKINSLGEERKLVREDSFQPRVFLVGLLHHATSDHGCAARWSGTASPPV